MSWSTRRRRLAPQPIIDLKLVQSQFQWNQRTGLIAAAIRA
ncbi:MAG: hypothetical protein WDN03_15450 [Rhizomicrobium sp.]